MNDKKELERRSYSFEVRAEKTQKHRIGLISFVSNKEARIVDTVLAVSFAMTVMTYVITKGSGSVCYVFIAATILSFCVSGCLG